MLKILRGYAEIRITGASPEDCLNRMTRADLPFWQLRREDAFSMICRIYLSQLPLVEEAARRSQCAVEVVFRRGLSVWAEGLRRRPVLVLGVLLAVAATLYLQNYVWFVRIEGPREIPEQLLREALKTEGVRFGAWGPSLDSQAIKNRMLNRIPELRWLGVNRSGGIVTVSAVLRAPEPPEPPQYAVTNIVASRPGIVTSVEVINGFPTVGVGDAVTEGQLLVSGLADWTTHTQATRSVAEVYAFTFRRMDVCTPETWLKRVYTGREETCRYLIRENKRRKISGNSSIFGTSCDKMISREVMSLPGGFCFPVEIETVVLREYRLEPEELEQEEAMSLLSTAADRSVGQNIIGTITSGSGSIQKKNGSFTMHAERYCEELISVSIPVKLLGEDGYSGETHQRGEN